MPNTATLKIGPDGPENSQQVDTAVLKKTGVLSGKNTELEFTTKIGKRENFPAFQPFQASEGSSAIIVYKGVVGNTPDFILKI